MCCNCRNFPILYKVVSFTLAGITSCILTWFLCAVNTHFLALLSELSSCLKYEAILKYCTNSLVKCQRTLSPMVVHVFLSQQSSTMLIPENLAQCWQKKHSQLHCNLAQLKLWKKRFQMYFTHLSVQIMCIQDMSQDSLGFLCAYKQNVESTAR